jgi:recombination associated protein RdgC
MLYKNAIFYILEEPIQMNGIEDKLDALISVEPPKHTLESVGFTPVLSDGEFYVSSLMGTHTFCLRKFKKAIPAAVVNYKLQKRLRSIEIREQVIGTKMVKQLKQEIINELSASIPASPSVIFFTYFEAKQLIVVNTNSFNNAETCLAMLRKALGTLKVKPMLQNNIRSTITSWVFTEEHRPKEITILEKGKLYTPDENKSEASFNRQMMDAEEVVASYNSGKFVKEMAMEFDELFSFVFTEDGIVKSIKFTDIARESMSEISKKEAAMIFDASMAINIDTIGQFSSFLKKQLAANS